VVFICLFETDEVHWQPDVVYSASDINVDISDAVKIEMGNKRYLYDLSTLTSRRDLGDFLLYSDLEVLHLVIIVY
jgi:hypothetical protein